jgi:hypothetical protein
MHISQPLMALTAGERDREGIDLLDERAPEADTLSFHTIEQPSGCPPWLAA